jgi:hypothetical protein
MTLSEMLSVLSDLVTIFALVVGAGLAMFVFLQFAPLVNLRIIHRWAGDDSRWVILRLEVENVSRVRIRKQHIRLQILEYELLNDKSLSEWVPFEEEKVCASEPPIEWKDPKEVFKTTVSIDPNEVLSVERLHYCPQNRVTKVGLQLRIDPSVFGSFVARVRRWDQQWTTTAIIYKS